MPALTRLKVVRNPSGKGGFQKGKSGNPKGRPPGRGYRHIPVDLQQLARQYTHEAFAKTLELMRSDDTPPNTVLGCVQIIFERGYGQPFKTEEKRDEHDRLLDIETMTIEELDAFGARVATAIESVKAASGDQPEAAEAAGGEAPAA
jgi:hypothetical protein